MDIVDFVEQIFGIELFDYQKVLLRDMPAEDFHTPYRGQRRLLHLHEDAADIFVDSTKPTEDYHRNGYNIVWSMLDELDVKR